MLMTELMGTFGWKQEDKNTERDSGGQPTVAESSKVSIGNGKRIHSSNSLGKNLNLLG